MAAPAIDFHPEEFRHALRDWFALHRRPLPWRLRPGLYATVVSEFMLQQTRVETVLPFFQKWMEALPDFKALASCPDERLLKLWEGLGYYRRAHYLRVLARELAKRAEWPRKAAEWMEMPGVGPYTAAAIASIAHGDPAACVDGNAARVLARITGWREALSGGEAVRRLFQPLAEQLLDPQNPGSHNQALMELGATVCRPRKPLCPSCPVRRFCQAQATGNAEAIPHLPKKTIESVRVIRIWMYREGRLLLHRSPKNSRRLANLHELPTAEQLGLDPENPPAGFRFLVRKQRSITRYRITEDIFEAPAAMPDPCHGRDGLAWVCGSQLESAPLSGPHRRWVKELLPP